MNGVERRQSIISAARPLFAKHGFRGTSVKAIAKAAGVSEGLLYKYFSSKDSLYTEILGYAIDLYDTFFTELEKLEAGAETLVKYVHLSVRLILFEVPGFKEAQHWHERLMFRSLIGDIRYAKAHFKNVQEHLAVRIPECVEAAVRAGNIVQVEIAPDNHYWFLHHLAMALNLCFLSKEPAFIYGGSKEDLARQVLLFSLRGIGMTPEAIDRFCRQEELEAFFHRLH